MRRALAVAACALLVGCGGAYTHIERLEDGSYLLVKNQAAVGGPRAVLFRCTPAGPTPDLRCVEIDAPK